MLKPAGLDKKKTGLRQKFQVLPILLDIEMFSSNCLYCGLTCGHFDIEKVATFFNL
jgi:hypothetical protein